VSFLMVAARERWRELVSLPPECLTVPTIPVGDISASKPSAGWVDGGY
jgi:hypothetical protein